MLPAWFVIFAVTLRLFSGASYAWAVITKRARPNPITWFFWSLTPMIAFPAQLIQHVGWSAATTLALGIGPLAVFILSLKHNLTRAHFTPSTIACGVLAAIGIVLWVTTSNPTLAIVFSILADIAGSVPTVLKAYHDPNGEFFPAYIISIVSMAITISTLQYFTFANFAFPAYIFAINLVIFAAGYFSPHASRRKLLDISLPVKDD